MKKAYAFLWVLFFIGVIGLILGITPIGFLVMPLILVEGVKGMIKEQNKNNKKR